MMSDDDPSPEEDGDVFKHTTIGGSMINPVNTDGEGKNSLFTASLSGRSKSDCDVSRTCTLQVHKACEVGAVCYDECLKRAASVDIRLIVMEEFAPMRTPLRSVSDDGEQTEKSKSWQMPLRSFTSKRRGRDKSDRRLTRSVRRYYKKQDELIAAFEGIHLDSSQSDNETISERTQHRRQAAQLAKLSFIMNFLLLCGKLAAAVLSGSLSVITSVIDSAVDLVSGVLMWWSSRAVKNRDPYLYPQGRTKLEPVAIVVLSVIMSLAAIQMIRQSIEKIVVYVQNDLRLRYNDSVVLCLTIGEMSDYVHMGSDKPPVFDVDSIIICSLTIGIKLILYLVCRRVPNPACRALANDHRNDVVSNTAAIGCGIIAYKLWKYADPIGAIVICVYILGSWFHMGAQQIKLLTGYTARPDFLKKLTWIAVNHHPKVRYVDTVRAFHFGNNFLVEVDIVLPADMTLMEAHDIGESLQQRLERLAEVERAFVHLDYETDHHPHSEHKVV